MIYRFGREKDTAYASILYTLTVFIFYFGMYYISDMEFYRAAVIGEFVLILLPAVIFVQAGVIRERREFLRLNKLKVSTGILITAIVLCSLPLFGLLNNIVYYLFSELFGAVEIYSVPVPVGLRELVLSLLVLALVPAICEEFLFRGVLQGIFRRNGHIFSIILSGALFSLLHLDIQRFIGIWLLGSLIGYMVYRTNSLYAGVVAHFINNATAVIISYLFLDASEIGEGGIQRITRESYSIFMTDEISVIISSIVLAVIFGALFFWLFARFIRATETTKEFKVETSFDKSSAGYLFLIPAVAFIILLYVLQSKSLITGIETMLR